MAHEIWLLVHRALKRARNAFNGICPRLTFNVTSPWRRCGPSIRASWCIVDLDEEDKGDEADEHQQYCVLKAVFEVACCHLAVFLVTVYLLISSFFKQLANTTFGGSSAVGGVGFSFISLPLPKITAVFLYMAMIEALFAGLVGGKMATGYLKDGLKHAILLMLICFITFVFFV